MLGSIADVHQKKIFSTDPVACSLVDPSHAPVIMIRIFQLPRLAFGVEQTFFCYRGSPQGQNSKVVLFKVVRTFMHYEFYIL